MNTERGWLVGVASLVVFVALWEGVVAFGWANPLFTSAPSLIYEAAVDLVGSPRVHGDLVFTARAFALAMVLATVIGTALGVLTGASELAYQLFNPWIVALNSLPKIALMPLVLLWFGMGLPSQLFLGTLMAGFPIVVSTQTGVRTIDRDFLMLARSYRASRWLVFRSILLPAVVPYILGGLRVGVTYAMVGILIVEFFGSSAGVGYRMVLYSSNFQIDPFFVLLLVVVAWTLGWTSVIKRVEDHVGRWRPQFA